MKKVICPCCSAIVWAKLILKTEDEGKIEWRLLCPVCGRHFRIIIPPRKEEL